MELTIILDEYNTEQLKRLTSIFKNTSLDESVMLNAIMSEGMQVIFSQFKGVLSDFVEGNGNGSFTVEDD